MSSKKRDPLSGSCPIGSYGAHTANYERTECIWCGPGALAWKEGEWVQIEDATGKWSAWRSPALEVQA